ncbi:MAG: hypothetical protein Q7U05_01005 [Polaromonas sp.]|nr:hypothetical protein [Polaromonas sp.]
MTITALPSLDRTASTFRSDTDTFFATQLPAFSVEAEAARVEINENTATATAAAIEATDQAALATINGAAQLVFATEQAELTAADAIGTAADRVQTGSDRTATGISAAAAETSRIAASKLNLGNKTTAPTTDNQGAALLAGATYFDTTLTLWRVWTGSAWAIGVSSVAGVSSINGQTGDVQLASTSLSGTTTIYVSQSIVYTITNYNVFSDYVVQVSAGTVSISGDTITFVAPASAQSVTLTVTTDSVPTAFPLTVLGAGVTTPTNSSPTSGATNQNGSVTLTSSAFAWLGVSDTHASSDWQLSTNSGFTAIVQSSTASTSNKTTWAVAGLSVSQTYYWRVKHTGAANGSSAYSTATSFTTAASFDGLIGTQGGQGFGVGTYSGTLPSGFSVLTGTTDKTSANYGNYQFTDSSIMVFVPRFYYRIGSTSSPRFSVYGANAIDVVGVDAYATEALANTAGYAMHRAFTDGGSAKSGFFLDKYLASKNSNSCKSVALGNPISLTTNASYNPSSGMTGCTGILADSIVLARSRGAGVFNVASIFMTDALAKLSLAHAQAATATTYCAWYDSAGTTNFPKGCNNGSLADTNDASVTFTTSGTGSAAKPLTGSASNLAKTTHNGQACGVTDVNGAMYQAQLGLTQAGTSDVDTTAITTGTAYVLKSSVALSSLTAGFGAAPAAWGTASNLATNYDSITGFLPWTSATGAVYFGNGSTQVFSGATSGTDYLRSCCGIGALAGMSAAGTSQFGNDYNYNYGTANLFPMASGLWSDAGSAGVFYRLWSNYRSNGGSYVGFRVSAYGN